MSFANYLTILRLVISPIFLILYLWHAPLGLSAVALPWVLMALLLVSELTDSFDGFLARRLGQVTDLGKILDPMADSVAHLSVFLTFTLPPVQLPMILVFVFLYRDSLIGTLRTVCALRGFALAARKSGKIKAVVHAISAFVILIMMVPHSLGAITTHTLKVTAGWVVLAAAVYTIYTAFEYFYVNRDYIRKLGGAGGKSE